MVINFLRLIHPEIILKEFTLAHLKENDDQFHKQQGLFSQEVTNKIETIPMPTCAGGPSTMSSTVHLEFPQNWSDSKDNKYRNYNSTGSLIHHHFWCGTQDAKHRPQVVRIFRRKQCYGSKKWRWLNHWKNGSPRDELGKNFPNFEVLDAKIASALNKINRCSQFKKNRKSRKRTCFCEGDKSTS